MKKFILLALVLIASVANASEVVVMDAALPRFDERNSIVDSRFYMDTKTGEGFVKASVTEETWSNVGHDWCSSYDHYGRCIPGNRHPVPARRMVFSDTVKVDGLMLMGDDVVFHSANGNVVCGTMGLSRVFKIPTLYLSGKCRLSSSIVRSAGQKRLVVTLKTK